MIFANLTGSLQLYYLYILLLKIYLHVVLRWSIKCPSEPKNTVFHVHFGGLKIDD